MLRLKYSVLVKGAPAVCNEAATSRLDPTEKQQLAHEKNKAFYTFSNRW